MTVQWQQAPDGQPIWRMVVRGKTRAAIIRDGDHATIVVSDMHGRETRAEVIGDNLLDNKITACDMLAATQGATR